MKSSKTAKPGRKPIAAGRTKPRSRSAQSSKLGTSQRSAGHELKRREPKPREAKRQGVRAKAPSVAMQLAAEVDALATELEASRARIVELEARVDIDPLTEIRNRRGFERELERSLAYVKRYGTSAALIYIDLDSFKPVNDRHGHAAGDAVLKALATALVRHVRTSDIVARVGGDEFAVLLWNVNGVAAAAKADALEAAIYATPVRWNSSTLVVGASAGMTLLGALDTPAEVLARADASMYARKAQRREGGSHARP
ncbi:MAG TPA: GGDEF domain-containing protein [Xanthobacteraceae bacterium]|jgi:diguanylate cyclase (GGDEF)-like protein|nr:GGDEF domain-containing protein [Xanthobacteraceae bacterium]